MAMDAESAKQGDAKPHGWGAIKEKERRNPSDESFICMSINFCTLDGIKGITQLNGISCGALNVSITAQFTLSPCSYIGIYVAFIYLFARRK